MFMKRFFRWPYIVVAAPIIFAIFVVVTGGLVMLLWNWLLPTLFGLPTITLWQAFGLLILSRMLFGSFGGGGGGRGPRPHHMSPEERERFRQRVRDRFCDPPAPAVSPGPASGGGV
jgi:hypothetical protein